MKSVILLIVVVFVSWTARAQAPLRLPDAVNIALKNSLDIQLSKNKISTDSINNHIGMAGGLPLVTGNLSDNEQLSSVNQKLNTGTTISRSAAASNSLNVGVTGSILLYNGGRVIATKKRLAELELQSRQELNSHIYGKKETRPGRKMGHITILSKEKQELIHQANRIKQTVRVVS